MYDKRYRGFVIFFRLIWKISFFGFEFKNNYFLFFIVYDVNRFLC